MQAEGQVAEPEASTSAGLSAPAASEGRYRCQYVHLNGRKCTRSFGVKKNCKEHLMIVHVAVPDQAAFAGYRVLPADSETHELWKKSAARKHRRMTPWPPKSYEPVVVRDRSFDHQVKETAESEAGDKRHRSLSPSQRRKKRCSASQRAVRRTAAAAAEVSATVSKPEVVGPTESGRADERLTATAVVSELSLEGLRQLQSAGFHGTLFDRLKIVRGLRIAPGVYVDVNEIASFMDVQLPPRPARAPTKADFLPSANGARVLTDGPDPTAAMCEILQQTLVQRPDVACTYCRLPRGPCKSCVALVMRPISGDDLGDSSAEACLRRAYNLVYPVYQELLVWFPTGPCRGCPTLPTPCCNCASR
jgi:hypothetical protein